MVRIIPNRLKSYTGASSTNSRSTSPHGQTNMMKKRDHSPQAVKPNGLMLRVVVLRVCIANVGGDSRRGVMADFGKGTRSCCKRQE